MRSLESKIPVRKIPSGGYKKITTTYNKITTTVYPGWWIVVLAIIGSSISVGPVMVYSFGIFVKPLAASFSASRASVSLALACLNIGAAISLPLSGRLIDRFGARKMITLSMTAVSFCLFGLSQVTPPLWQLLLLYGLIGIAGSGSSPVAFGKLIASWFNRKRGLALGIAGTGIGLGGLIFPWLTQSLISQYGWGKTYLVLGCISLFIGVPLIGFLSRNKPEDAGLLPDNMTLGRKPIAEKGWEGVPVKEAIKTKTFRAIVFIYFIVAATGIGTIAHLSPMLTDHGISARSAAIATSLFGTATIIGRITNGLLIDRFFAPYIAAISLLGAVIGLALLWSGTGILIAVALIGHAMGSEADVIPFLLSRYFGTKSLGALFGIVFSAFTTGVAVGPYLFGLAFDRAHSYTVPLACACLLLLVAVTLMCLLKKYKLDEQLSNPIK